MSTDRDIKMIIINKNSASRGIIHTWQVIRCTCSTYTDSCIIQCSGYDLYVELTGNTQKNKKLPKFSKGHNSANIR